VVSRPSNVSICEWMLMWSCHAISPALWFSATPLHVLIIQPNFTDKVSYDLIREQIMDTPSAESSLCQCTKGSGNPSETHFSTIFHDFTKEVIHGSHFSLHFFSSLLQELFFGSKNERKMDWKTTQKWPKNTTMSTEVFTLPHVIHMDSSGLQWIPVVLLSGQIGWYNAQSTGVQSSPLDSKPLFRVQSESTGIHWNPLDWTLILYLE